MLLLTLDIYPGVLPLCIGTDEALVTIDRNVDKRFVSGALPIDRVYKERHLPASVTLAGILCN